MCNQESHKEWPLSIAIFNILYINDLPDPLKSSDARLFADGRLHYLTVNGAIRNKQLQDLSTGGMGTSVADIKVLSHMHHLWQVEEKESLSVFIIHSTIRSLGD